MTPDKLDGSTRIVRGLRRPDDEEGITWAPLHEDPFKPQRITGWLPVATDVYEMSIDELPPLGVGTLRRDPPQPVGTTHAAESARAMEAREK